VDVAAVNGPTQTVLSGEPAAIAVVEKSLKEKEIMCKILRTSHAFHSAMLDPVLDSFRQEVEKVKLQRGQIPFVSNLSGQLITAEEAQSPDYWVRHMRHAVRFLDGMSGLLERSKKSVLIELGPGRVLSGLTRQLRQDGQIPLCINTIRSIKNKVADERFYTESLGKIWASGIALNWEAVHQDRPCRRVSLPTYAFDPIAYPTIIDPFKMLTGGAIGTKAHSTLRKDWLYRPYWKSSFWLPNNGEQESPSSVLIFADRGGLASKLAKEYQQANATCIQVWTGEQFETTDGGYLINPSNGQDYRLLFESLANNKQLPQQIIHCWTFEAVERKNGHRKKEDHYRNLGYHSLQHIARNLSTDSIRIEVMSNRALAVQAGESVQVEKGTLLGVVKVLPLEFPFVQCRLIDVEDLTERNFIGLKKEIHQSVSEQFVALRNGSRYVQDLEAVSFAQPETFQQLCKGGTYLITGAMGGVGRTLTEYLLDVYQANLILLSRRPADDKYLSALQTKGGQVVYLSADVSEEADWKTQLREAVQELGAIQGVIHAAGLADKAGVILRRSEAAEEALFRAKINGLDNLLNVVKDMPLDFFLACSSQSTLFPDPGQVGAVASNAYLDAHASKTSYPFPYISMGWETISDVGLATDFIAQLKEPEQSQLLKDCIQSSDLPELLELALHLQLPHILVGKKDLVQELHTVADPGQAEELDDGFDNFVLQKVARPDLSSAYQEPQTETEEELVELLENFFGIEGIGREDDIFELGADSLKIMVVNKRISKHFGVELSLQEFYDHPLIRSIAREIATAAKIVQMQQEEKPSNVITEIII
ncbi:MAG: SDR family NAD(P)-dependent oxidoreductase, partial [Bacteroidota bacterium]